MLLQPKDEKDSNKSWGLQEQVPYPGRKQEALTLGNVSSLAADAREATIRIDVYTCMGEQTVLLKGKSKPVGSVM